MTDYEIDIEEHDLLDNPVIKRVFPDISVLKKELFNFNDQVPTAVSSIQPDINMKQKNEEFPIVVIKQNENEVNKIKRLASSEKSDTDIRKKSKEKGNSIREVSLSIPDDKIEIKKIDEIRVTRNIVNYFPLGRSKTLKNKVLIKSRLNLLEENTNNSRKETNSVVYPNSSSISVVKENCESLLCHTNNQRNKIPNKKKSILHKNDNPCKKPVTGYLTSDINNVIREEKKEFIRRSHSPTSFTIENKIAVNSICNHKTIDSNDKSSVLCRSLKKTTILTNSIKRSYTENLNGTLPASSVTSLHSNMQISTDEHHRILEQRPSFKNEKSSYCPIKKPIAHLNSNKILGTMPGVTKTHKPIVTCNVKVLIENIKTFLSKSSRYCKICLILFPSNKTLGDHNKLVHAEKGDEPPKISVKFNEANKYSSCITIRKFCKSAVKNRYNCNICEKKFSSLSNFKEHKQLHSKNIEIHSETIVVSKEQQPSNLSINRFDCTHCNTKFSSHQLLIDHMYEILKYKQGNKVKPAQRDDKTSDRQKINLKLFHRCSFCSYYFKQEMVYVKHCQNEHNITGKINLRKVAFDPHCKHCSKKYSNVLSFNSHVWKHHLNTWKKRKNIRKINTYITKTSECKKMSQKISMKKFKKRKNEVSHVNTSECQKETSDKNKLNESKKNKNEPITSSLQSKSKKEVCNNNIFILDDIRCVEQNQNNDLQPTGVNGSVADVWNKYFLNSVLFKCMECDICFLSSQKAADHRSHMSIDTKTWKCLKCLRIFINEEQDLHNQQHFCSDLFDVFDICKRTLKLVLYKCPNCITYFFENDFFNHYIVCEKQSPDSAYCKICHILIDNKIKESHEMQHKQIGGKKLNNIFVESDVTLCNKENNRLIIESHDIHNKIMAGKELNKTLAQSDKIIERQERGNELRESDVDISKRNNRNNEASWTLYETNVIMCNEINACEREESHDSTEKRNMNYVENNLKLIKETDDRGEKNEMEISMENNKFSPNEINKKKNRNNLLRFMYCNFCKCFIYVSRVRKLYNHSKLHCANVDKYVCKFCGLVLSKKSINSHRNLHQYLPGLTINNYEFYDLQSGKIISPPIPRYPNCHTCGIHFITKISIVSHRCNDDHIMCPICKIKLSTAAFPLHMSFHNYLLRLLPTTLNNESSFDVSNDTTCLEKNISFVNTQTQNNKTCGSGELLVYMCKICKVTVDVYDRVIEHCHDHISSQELEIQTKPCGLCNIIIDSTCFENHKLIHKNSNDRKFTVLSFDAFYTTTEEHVWHTHLFGSLAKNVISKILCNSIYFKERRLKMHIFQDGLPHLTFYKCVKCKCFIDSPSLYSHYNFSILCNKAKGVPCSICGILLISNKYRQEHEKIHDKYDVTVKSYRIVIFNSDEDKNANRLLSLQSQYILYECRNCNAIVEKSHFQNHTCDLENLLGCPHCGLLLCNNDYMAHVIKHKEFCSFNKDNMTVILIGQYHYGDEVKRQIKSMFTGKKLNYLFYQCPKCKICFKEKDKLSHNCVMNSAKTMCPTCELYFDDGIFKSHRRWHELDPLFLKENLTIEVIQSSLINSSSSEIDILVINDEDGLENKKLTDSTLQIKHFNTNYNEVENSSPISVEKISPRVIGVEKTADLYKCFCGVHFLNESSALSHFKAIKCNRKKNRFSKQICSKCGLSFKTSVLYDHLLKHHGKQFSYKFNIIQISSKIS